MCQKCIFLFPRAHFLGATRAPPEPVHESFLKTPPSPWPTEYGCSLYSELPLKFVDNWRGSCLNVHHCLTCPGDHQLLLKTLKPSGIPVFPTSRAFEVCSRLV